jgi:hypothetical protein
MSDDGEDGTVAEPADSANDGKGLDTPRNPGIATMVTKFFELIGILNKGSSRSPATPKTGDAAATAGVSSNSLNVTRVGGFAAFIASAGAAALAIFNVNSTTTRASIVVAAYASVGAIVSAALLTAAIIISADIRARVATNPPPSPSPSPSGPAASKALAKTAATDAATFSDAWYRALSMLHDAVDRLDRSPDSTSSEVVEAATTAWLDAAASTGKTQSLKPADDDQVTLQARLSTGQSSVVSLFKNYADSGDATKKAAAITRIRSVLDSLDQSLPWPDK